MNTDEETILLHSSVCICAPSVAKENLRKRTNMPNTYPKLHNAAWPGVVGKGSPGAEPSIDLDTMLDLTAAELSPDGRRLVFQRILGPERTLSIYDTGRASRVQGSSGQRATDPLPGEGRRCPFFQLPDRPRLRPERSRRDSRSQPAVP